jgi:hypothetical protein
MDRVIRRKLVTPIQYLRHNTRSGAGVETTYAAVNLMCFNYKRRHVEITSLGPVENTQDVLYLEYSSALVNLSKNDSFILDGRTYKVKDFNLWRKHNSNIVDSIEVII